MTGRPSRRRIATAAWIEVLAVILTGTPSLPGALCRGHATLFDGDTVEDRAAAKELCRRCPALSACHAWAQQHQPLAGVIAGRYHGAHRTPINER